MLWQRSTSCCGADFARDKGSRTRLCLGLTTTVTDLVRMRSSHLEDRLTMIPSRVASKKWLAISAEHI
jgi:hypothetical protein